MEELLKKLVTFDHDDYYVVGVSGGSDSMCLLDLLRRSGLKLVICHVDYSIRNDTQVDYQIVHDYALKYGIDFHFKKITEYPKENFEQVARWIRYDFYAKIGQEYGTNKVFLGHHKDDVLETILMQRDRHNPYIKQGIEKETVIRGNHVYRILLDYTKKEILEYCKQNKITYHDDYTNFDIKYKRNYYRNVVLSKLSDDKKQEILDEANRHNEKLERNEENYKKVLEKNCKEGKLYYLQISQEDLQGVLRLYLMDYLPIKRITQSLVEEIALFLKNGKPNGQIVLPVNLRFIKEYDNGYIQSNKEMDDYEYEFSEFKSFECPYFKLSMQGHPHAGIGLKKEDYPITIRNFRPGDRIETKYGHKKVSRLFIDQKIPLQKRKEWPIVVNQKGEIVLIPHIAKNFRYFSTKANVFVLK